MRSNWNTENNRTGFRQGTKSIAPNACMAALRICSNETSNWTSKFLQWSITCFVLLGRLLKIHLRLITLRVSLTAIFWYGFRKISNPLKDSTVNPQHHLPGRKRKISQQGKRNAFLLPEQAIAASIGNQRNFHWHFYKTWFIEFCNWRKRKNSENTWFQRAFMWKIKTVSIPERSISQQHQNHNAA